MDRAVIDDREQLCVAQSEADVESWAAQRLASWMKFAAAQRLCALNWARFGGRLHLARRVHLAIS
jgi:hypothetical protein